MQTSCAGASPALAPLVEVQRQLMNQPDSSPRLRVLVVGPVRAEATRLRSMLQAADCDARTAAGGQPALDVGDFVPDVALLDLELCGTHGGELARSLRRQFPKCMLIAVTATEQWDPRLDGFSDAFSFCLPKPLKDESLATLLAACSPSKTA